MACPLVLVSICAPVGSTPVATTTSPAARCMMRPLHLWIGSLRLMNVVLVALDYGTLGGSRSVDDQIVRSAFHHLQSRLERLYLGLLANRTIGSTLGATGQARYLYLWLVAIRIIPVHVLGPSHDNRLLSDHLPIEPLQGGL
uniref:Putative secreted protein n=1 Tax=Anopheles triannulatus TaxID=58253 RepID=A0A2M4B5I7_9DIPT